MKAVVGETLMTPAEAKEEEGETPAPTAREGEGERRPTDKPSTGEPYISRRMEKSFSLKRATKPRLKSFLPRPSEAATVRWSESELGWVA